MIDNYSSFEIWKQSLLAHFDCEFNFIEPEISLSLGMTPAGAVLWESLWSRRFGHILNARFDTKYLTE